MRKEKPQSDKHLPDCQCRWCMRNKGLKVSMCTLKVVYSALDHSEITERILSIPGVSWIDTTNQAKDEEWEEFRVELPVLDSIEKLCLYLGLEYVSFG